MSGSFRNKLLQYETPPPPAVWEQLSDELGQERNYVARRKVIPLLYKRLAAAVIVAAVVAASLMYFFAERANSFRIPVIAKNNPDIKVDRSNILSVPSPASSIAPRHLSPASVSNWIIENKPKLYAYRTESAVNAVPSETSTEISKASFIDVQIVDTQQLATVPAPLIRDANGNIIMDVNLISKPNDPYITVTGPNGSQTKISTKFLSCLSYLNSDISHDDNGDGIIWKNKFQSWREKLLNENSFIPAASNFFDIFEMKDIIQE